MAIVAMTGWTIESTGEDGQATLYRQVRMNGDVEVIMIAEAVSDGWQGKVFKIVEETETEAKQSAVYTSPSDVARWARGVARAMLGKA